MLVIEQYTITTTPKYNFPQPSINPTLPQYFTLQSLQSLREAKHHPFQLNQQQFQQFNVFEQNPLSIHLNRQPIALKQNYQETAIGAVDTSTIKIGETNRGIIIAIRGATIKKEKGNCRYTRIGPFIFHITEENKKEIYDTLAKSYFGNYCFNNCTNSNLQQIPSKIASLLERWMQTMLAKTLSNGIVLFDGSLTSVTTDTPTQYLKETLDTARRSNNVVLAFTKMTSLRVNDYLITDYLPNHEPPYILETRDLKFRPPILVLGEVYVAKLSRANYAFRLDIDKETAVPKRIDAIEKLLGNDLHTQGYPETLRLAHILCTFTANEVLAIKHFISRKHGIKIINRPDMHRILFGPFGREVHS